MSMFRVAWICFGCVYAASGCSAFENRSFQTLYESGQGDDPVIVVGEARYSPGSEHAAGRRVSCEFTTNGERYQEWHQLHIAPGVELQATLDSAAGEVVITRTDTGRRVALFCVPMAVQPG